MSHPSDRTLLKRISCQLGRHRGRYACRTCRRSMPYRAQAGAAALMDGLFELRNVTEPSAHGCVEAELWRTPGGWAGQYLGGAYLLGTLLIRVEDLEDLKESL